MKILLATENEGKVKEIKELFSNADLDNLELICLKDLPSVPSAIEDGNTFLANAYIKAMYYYNIFKIPCICDDTGLCIDYLNGAPGIYTARYGSLDGEKTDTVKNMQRVLKELGDTKNRNAHFTCAMYFYDGKMLISSVGQMFGEIAHQMQGTNGFGYDPIFYVPAYKTCVAELSSHEKNQISHRGNALRLLVSQLKDYYRTTSK